MPKLKNHDLPFWNLFVHACGARCNACGKSGVPLERGHLQRHADGGAATFDNLIPLCKPCNAAFKGLTPDTRPADWLDRFWKLLVAEGGVGLRRKTGGSAYSEAGQPKPYQNTSQVIENTESLDWQGYEFVKANLLYPTYKQADPPKPLTDHEATKLIEETIRFARSAHLTTPPLLPRKGKLIQLVKTPGLTVQDFKLAVKYYLAMDPQPWPARHPDPWAFFCDNFKLFLEDARDQQAARKVAEEQERKRRAEEAAPVQYTDEQKKFFRSRQELHASMTKFVADVAAMEDFSNKDDLTQSLNNLLEFLRKISTQRDVDSLAEQFEVVRSMVENERNAMPSNDF